MCKHLRILHQIDLPGTSSVSLSFRMPKLHFVDFVLISLIPSVAFSRFEDLFGDEDLWRILLHVEGLLGFSAFPPMT